MAGGVAFDFGGVYCGGDAPCADVFLDAEAFYRGVDVGGG